MIIKNISYSSSIESLSIDGLKSWNKCGGEAELEPGEDALEQFAKLKEMVHKFHGSNKSEESPSIPIIQVNENYELRVDSMIADLNMVTKIDETNSIGVQVGLMAYEFESYRNARIREAYEKKWKELENK